MEYLKEFTLYEAVNVGGRQFILIHSLPKGFDPYLGGQLLLEYCAQPEYGDITGVPGYTMEEIIFGRPDFTAEWNQDLIYVVGHTPTFIVDPDCAGRIYRKGNLIDIDCGCAAGHTLCAYCLDNGMAFYVNRELPFAEQLPREQ